MTDAKVFTATRAEIDQCVSLLALAFSTDPAARWVYKDPHAYTQHFPRFIRAFGCAAFDYDTAHHVDGCATALWIPPGEAPSEDALVAVIEESIPRAEQALVFELFEEMGRNHPDEPHWYLPLIGSDPAQQGRGHGSALLKHALALCDVQKMRAYLEATSPRNVALYQRHGFEVTGEVRVGTCPVITPMVRQPR